MNFRFLDASNEQVPLIANSGTVATDRLSAVNTGKTMDILR
jgi:hypothetical protein